MTQSEIMERGVVMRQELGPIVNFLASEIFETAEIPSAAGRVFDPESPNLRDVVRFLNRAHQMVIVNMQDRIHHRDDSTALHDIIVGVRSLKLINSPHVNFRLYFADTLYSLMHEGLSSGMVMPMQAYVMHVKETLGESNVKEMSVDVSHANSTLRDPHFQAALLKLSNVPNGTYKARSSEIESIGDRVFGNVMADTLFEPGSFRLNDYFKETYGKKIFETSDGCPVRRATYPVLGEHALRFADLKGIDPDNLRYQHKSAIVAGCEFVARCLAAIKEQNQ